MFQEDIALVRRIVKEEIAVALADFKLPKAPKLETPKPVDVEEIVKLVLSKLPKAEAPKKGKEK